MANKSTYIKWKKRKDVNIGIVIFSFILVYLLINLYIFFTKPHLSIYEVAYGTNKAETTATGMILRTEELVYNTEAGYVNYYIREGARVAKGEGIYSVNDDSNIYDLLRLSEDTVALSEKDMVRMKNKLAAYQNAYSDSSFSDIYEKKDDFQAEYLQSLDTALLDALQEKAGNSLSSSFATVFSPKSGIVTYYSDIYDGFTADFVSASCYQDVAQFSSTQLRATSVLGQKEPAYKLVTSNTWEIVFLLTKEQYFALSEQETLQFTIEEETYHKKAEFYQKEGSYFAKITMDRYLTAFLDKRFITAELAISTEEGLKIPRSSVTTKKYYRIPESYITHGGNEDENTVGITMEQYDKEKGETAYLFSPITVFYTEDGFYYVDEDDFDSGSYIVQLGTETADTGTRTMLYTLLTDLEGVYNVNKGYAVFKRIESLVEDTDYLIIKENTKAGLAVYDHIVLDATTADGAIISDGGLHW